MIVLHNPFTYCKLFLLACLLTTTIQAQDSNQQKFEEDCRALTASPHRMTGTPEYEKAAAYIQKRLKEIGVDKIFIQDFPTTNIKTRRCELVREDKSKLKLHPMRPNGIATPTTPKDGITGVLVYAGKGKLRDYKKRMPKGKTTIVVLDYNSREGWLQAFRLGANAVIFTRESELHSDTFHYVHVSANMPRFFFDGKHSELPIGETVTIHSEVTWEHANGRNILAYIKGEYQKGDEKKKDAPSAVLDSKHGEEAFVLAANLDTYGEVPELSKGARGAINCAGLLQVAEYIVKNRPRRNTLVAFFDAKWNGHAGSGALYKLFDPKNKDDLREKEKESLDEEEDFLNKLLALSNNPEPLNDPSSDLRYPLILRLKKLSANRVFKINRDLIDLRTDKHELEKRRAVLKKGEKIELMPHEEPGKFDCIDKLEVVERKISGLIPKIEMLEEKKKPWNNLRRTLTKDAINHSEMKDVLKFLLRNKLRHLRHVIQSATPSPTAGSVRPMVEEEEYKQAMPEIRKLLVDNSDDVELRILLATCLLELDKYQNALEETEAALRLRPALKDESYLAAKKADLKAKTTPAMIKIKEEIEKKKELAKTALGSKARQLKKEIASLKKQVYKEIESSKERRAYVTLEEEIADIVKHQEIIHCYRTVIAEEKVAIDARLEELAKERETYNVDGKIYDTLGDQWIALHVSMLFGNATNRWGLVIGGDSRFKSQEDKPGLYNRVQSGFLDAYRELSKAGVKLEGFEPKTADLSLSPPDAIWCAPKLSHSGDVAGRMGFYNLAFATVHESLPYEGTPDDQLDKFDLAKMLVMFKDSAKLCQQAENSHALSLDRVIKHYCGYNIPYFTDGKPDGAFVMSAVGSSIPDTPTPGAVVQLYFKENVTRGFSRDKVYGQNGYQVVRTNLNGTYRYGPALSGESWWLKMNGFGAVFNERGEIVQASSNQSFSKVKERLDVRDCNSGCMVLPPLQIVETGRSSETKILDGTTNGLTDLAKSFAYTGEGIIFWYVEKRTRSIKAFNVNTIAFFNNGLPGLLDNPNLKDLPMKKRKKVVVGVGVPLEYGLKFPQTTHQAASDLWRLDDYRLDVLRARGVKDRSISALHGRAEDLILEADRADTESEAEAKAASSLHLQRRVYTEVRSSLDDLVFAVLILLALCVPFAFAVERLLIGSTSVYRQIMWFAAFFVITFLMLYETHPAFAISNAPLIIFLGFTILILSTMVIWIIMRKFEVELKVLQGLESTVHAADISRVSTIVAAMNMGISSMRRRPLRTALSAVTIILLTFTILCFASFGKETDIIHRFSQPAPEYSAVYVRDYNWAELSEDLQEVIQGRWSAMTKICRRYWLSPGMIRNKQSVVLISGADGSSPLPLRGILGMDYQELDSRPKLAALLSADKNTFDNTVWITGATAEFIKVKPGDKVMLKGLPLTVGKLLDEAQLSMITDMDDSSILPVDFEEDSSVSQQGSQDPSEMEQKSWKTISVDACAIVSTSTAKAMNANLRAMVLYTKDPQVAGDVADAIARFVPTPIAATLPDGVYLHILGITLSASGVKDLFFPILLGGLVIFGTMLGSVADREKEVYTFSALGLAPPHVAGLFFAEALVYSVIGGMSGYLIAQGTMKLLEFFASMGWVQVPDMNYSSTNAIVTILLVMVTVLVSALYPAYKASKSANPGVMRNWKVPPPKGNVLDLVFPFTVSQYDITGVVSFLREHFDTYSDTGLGTFMAQKTKLIQSEGQLQLGCELALAPFDLGVTEKFLMKSVPSEIEGIDEVAISLTRLSGQPKDWYRLNKVLLDDLRKQFLIWRSLPPETMELYRERTLTELGRGPGSEAKEGPDDGVAKNNEQDDQAQGGDE